MNNDKSSCYFIAFCFQRVVAVNFFYLYIFGGACFEVLRYRHIVFVFFFGVFFYFCEFSTFLSLLLKVEMLFFISTLQQQHRAFELFR